jgi:hypothetical protein
MPLIAGTDRRVNRDGGVVTGPERAGDRQPSCSYRPRGGGDRTNMHPRPHPGGCFPLVGMGTWDSMGPGR